jgi:hypothetical protein
MKKESLDQIEDRIIGVPIGEPPRTLRAAVLADVQRELQAASWDRRLGRTAALMLVVSVGLNAVVAWQSAGLRSSSVAAGPTRDSLVHTAVIVAEATDAPTARRYVRQFAALRGRRLSGEDSAAINAAVERATPTATARENKG